MKQNENLFDAFFCLCKQRTKKAKKSIKSCLYAVMCAVLVSLYRALCCRNFISSRFCIAHQQHQALWRIPFDHLADSKTCTRRRGIEVARTAPGWICWKMIDWMIEVKTMSDEFFAIRNFMHNFQHCFGIFCRRGNKERCDCYRRKMIFILAIN